MSGGWYSWNSLQAQLNRIEANLRTIIKQETQMAIDLTAMTAEVANNTSVASSVVTLLGNLTALIKAIPVSTDPVTQAALDQLSATLAANDTTIAGAVVSNTPAAPAAARAK